MTQLISADMGRSESKFYSNGQKLKFRSIIGDWHSRNLSTGGDYEVKIDDQNMFIGELALKESYLPRSMETESKIHEETLYLFLVGVSLLMQGENLVVVTGLPVKMFKPECRDDIVNLLKGKHTITFQGCRPKQIYINEISVMAEGSGTYFYELKKRPELKQGKVRVINIGSKTINFITIEDNSFTSKGSDTLDYGMNLNNSKTDKKQFARKVIGDMSQKWNDYNDSDTVLISGGGIITLESYMRQHFKKVIVSDEPIYSDVLGFYEKITQVKYGSGRLNVAIAK